MVNLLCSEFKSSIIIHLILIHNYLCSKFTARLNYPVHHTAGFPKTGYLFQAD